MVKVEGGLWGKVRVEMRPDESISGFEVQMRPDDLVIGIRGGIEGGLWEGEVQINFRWVRFVLQGKGREGLGIMGFACLCLLYLMIHIAYLKLCMCCVCCMFMLDVRTFELWG